jgi:hypothetical protein
MSAVRSHLTMGLALLGAGFVTAAQITPPLQQAETRVVQAAVTLAAAVGNGQPCSGYNTDGCDINAPQSYTPLVINQSGSAANIAANIVNAVTSIPRAFVDAINELSYALEVTGSWWVYSPTNVLGFDPADPPKITALADLFIPFKPLSNVVGEHLSWWAKANLPMDQGCTADVGPLCKNIDSLTSKMLLVPIWTLVGGYQFPTVVNPVSAAEGELGDEIPGSDGTETAWSGANVKLDLADPATSLFNYFTADPSTNTPKPITGAEIAATLQRLGKALVLDFNAFVPRSFLLKGWPFTALTPLFKPFVPLLCPTCDPNNPGGPPVTPAESAAATLVSASATPDLTVDSTDSTAPAVDAAAADTADSSPADSSEPGSAKTAKVTAADVKAASDADPTGASAPADSAAPGTDQTNADAAKADDANDASAAADAPAQPASKPHRGARHSRTSTTGAAASADTGTSPAKARVRAAAAGE